MIDSHRISIWYFMELVYFSYLRSVVIIDMSQCRSGIAVITNATQFLIRVSRPITIPNISVWNRPNEQPTTPDRSKFDIRTDQSLASTWNTCPRFEQHRPRYANVDVDKTNRTSLTHDMSDVDGNELFYCYIHIYK